MKLSHILSIAFLAGAAEALACTGLIATPGATTDGSSLVTYAADSHTLYGELQQPTTRKGRHAKLLNGTQASSWARSRKWHTPTPPSAT